MSRYYLRTLGRLSLHEEDREGEVVMSDAKVLAVLAYLADTPDGASTRTRLARLLWPDKGVSRGRAGLRQALYYLRQKTPDDVSLVRRDEDHVALDRSVLAVDLWAFRDALSREDWAAVLDLHGGAFLGGYDVEGAEEFRHWRDSKDDGLRAGLREACRALVSAGLEDEPERALRGARRWVQLNPLDEEAQSALVRSLVANGDRAGAYQAYESYRTLLREELGESPGPRLTRVLDELRSLALEGESGTDSGEEPSSSEEAGEWRPEAVRAAGSAESPSGGVSRGAPSGIRRGLAGAVLALAVLLLGAAGWQMLAEAGGSAGGEAIPSLDTEILVETGAPTEGRTVHRIQWFGDSARVEEASEGPTGSVVSPGGRRVAAAVKSPEGPNLAVEDLAGGDRRILVATEADEVPVTWSPDGRRILYSSGRARTGEEYRRWYRVHRLRGSREDSLGLALRTPAGTPALGDWSPLGTAIAVVSDSAGNVDIWTVHPDGSGARNLTADHDGWDGDPAYSPDGSRIAFSSDRSGSTDVWVVDADGGAARRVTTSGFSDRRPVWLDSNTVGCFREQGNRAEFYVADLLSGNTRRIAELPDLPRRVSTLRYGSARPWLASVELPPHLSRLAPGQWLRRAVTLRDSAEEPVPARRIPLRWSVSDTSVLGLEEGEWLRVRGTGEATLRVTAGGWRSDSVRLRSLALRQADLRPVLTEDWSGGMESSRWVPVGDPAPAIVQTEGRFRSAFLNRGDENYDSGAAARRELKSERGLTVEFWGRAPFTGPRYQGLTVGLLEELPAAGAPAWTAEDAVLEFGIGSGVPDSLGMRLPGWIRTNVPAPPSVESWHRYTVQVDTAGRVSLLVDGRMHWRSPETVDLELLDGTHLALYGRSKGTRVLHGPVKVWEGVRYRIP